jgi:hypothetical protein
VYGIRIGSSVFIKQFAMTFENSSGMIKMSVDLGVREFLSNRFIKGNGIEVGALHQPLPIPTSAKIRYVDRMDVNGLRSHYPELNSLPLVNVDVIDDGEKLATFKNQSVDFIIANHFIEHTQDPIGTIKRFMEVLKPDAVLYMAVPDKRWTFDLKRPVTPLEHLFRDHNEGPAWSYMDHVREWASLVANLTGDALQAYINKTVETQYSIHFHVWTQKEFLEMLIEIRKRLNLPYDISAVMINQSRQETITVLTRL